MPSPTLTNVHVTMRAAERWASRNPRKHARGNIGGTISEVVAAAKASRKCDLNEVLPIGRKPRSDYYYHPATGMYLVVKPIGPCAGRVVTVIVPDGGCVNAPMLVSRAEKYTAFTGKRCRPQRFRGRSHHAYHHQERSAS